MPFSEYTDPGLWLPLYADLPDDLDDLVKVVKNLLIHPNNIRRHGIRLSPQGWSVMRELFTVERLLHALKRPPESLTAERSAYRRLVVPCDVQALLMASFCEAKGYEVRLRCGFARYIARQRWVFHWVTEVRGPFFTEWKLVDPDRMCRPPRSGFRSGAEWWLRRDVELVRNLAADRFHGPDAVKFAMLNDFNALNRHELIHYRWLDPASNERAPRVFAIGCGELGPDHLKFLNEVADAAFESDQAKLETLFMDTLYRRRPAARQQ